jgi:hypothetical protein
MFGDFKKFLSASLQVYLFLLAIIFIMKLVGLDYFGIDTSNEFINYMGYLVSKHQLANNIIYIIPLVINQYVLLSISANDNSKRMIIYNLIILPIFFVFECIKIPFFGNCGVLVEILYSLMVLAIYTKKLTKDIIKRFFKVLGLILIIQIISIITRTNNTIEYVLNPILNIILNLDYIILLIIMYKVNFMKGEDNLCGYQVGQCFSSLKKEKLKKSLKELLENLHNLNKEDKIAYIIYLTLSLIWNLFTVITVILIGILNGTVVECIFILTSFWISKMIFRKSFHLKSMIQCFVLSNLSYYLLNRVTAPIGISILVPILLGVGLSYGTTKLRKELKPLYKGMPLEDFDSSILRVVDKDSDKYKICYDFFIEKKNAILLGRKYNYTEAGIRKITSRVNDKIKALK